MNEHVFYRSFESSARTFKSIRTSTSNDDGGYLRFPMAGAEGVSGSSKAKHERIEQKPSVKFGKPVIVGTRIPVELILRYLAAADTAEEIIADYPALTLEDIRAAQAYAADVLANEYLLYR